METPARRSIAGSSSAGVAGWVEFTLLRRTLNARIGRTGLPASLVAQLWFAAEVAAAAAWGVKIALGAGHPLQFGLIVIATYGVTYLACAWLLGDVALQQHGLQFLLGDRRLRARRRDLNI